MCPSSLIYTFSEGKSFDNNIRLLPFRILSMEMSRLTRDGTAEPVSLDQIFRREGGREIFIFPVQVTMSRIGNLTRLILTLLYVMTIHSYISWPYRAK